jgi:hypothetical protein
MMLQGLYSATIGPRHGKGRMSLHSFTRWIQKIGLTVGDQKVTVRSPSVISEALVQDTEDYIMYTFLGKIARLAKNPNFGLHVNCGEPYRSRFCIVVFLQTDSAERRKI